MLLLDTHILLRVLTGNLTKSEQKVMKEDPDWAISGIVLWEIEMLKIRNRIPHGLEDPHLKNLLEKIRILPITPEVCLKLQLLDFHSDPADEIIAATGLAHNTPLVTRDTNIRTSKLLQFA